MFAGFAGHSHIDRANTAQYREDLTLIDTDERPDRPVWVHRTLRSVAAVRARSARRALGTKNAL